MTFQYPVEIARDLISQTSQFSQQSMEVHGIGLVCNVQNILFFKADLLQIEKLFDVACSLTDVLSLLPSNPDPFIPGPRDYLHDFLTLLSVLRNGDNRFLPLLLSKVHDVLPRLVNPMLQTVPDTPANLCADVDIFDGFGNAGIGLPSNFPGYNGNGTSGPGEFKLETQADNDHGQGFHRSSSVSMPLFDKRIEELGSPSGNGESSSSNSSFASPPILQSPMEYPGLAEYGGFPHLTPRGMSNDMSRNIASNFGEGVGGGGGGIIMEFKREFDSAVAMIPRQGSAMEGMRHPPPLRQGSSNFGMQMPTPRSVPCSSDQYRHPQLQRVGSNGEGIDIRMGGTGHQGRGELPFR